VFVLLAPEAAGADHLKALARIARLLRDPKVAEKLRTVADSDQMFGALTAPAAAA
jgi:PTS system nitrogen regulatory IIA component